MNVRELRVPLALLMDRRLGASAKVVWMVLGLDRPDGARLNAAGKPAKPSIARLAKRAGLARITVRKALCQLGRAYGHPALWNTRTPAQQRNWPGPAVSIPVDLVTDGSLSAQARVTYGLLQGAPGFRHPSGEAMYLEIGRLAGKDPRTVKKAVGDLVSAGWLEIAQANQCAPVRFTLGNPAAAKRERALARVKRRIERAPFLGEALMREYLSLIVDSEEFEDNAAPGFLVNPLTDERLQFDRYYPPSVAFEFNGPQHYRATQLFSAEEVAKQRARDLIKQGICVERGIKLIVVHAEDLSLEAMRRKVEGHLPVRRDPDEGLINYLEQVSRPYRRSVRRRERSAAGRQMA